MGKNKGQNNANDMRAEGRNNGMNETTGTQTQNKTESKKGSGGKQKNSGAQG